MTGQLLTSSRCRNCGRTPAYGSGTSGSNAAAGLLVWQDNRNFVRWHRAANGDRGDVFVHGECWNDANRGPLYYAHELGNGDRTMQNVTAHLRLTRRGDRMTSYRSQNGKSWEAFPVVPDCPLDDTLPVEIAAVNSAKKEFSPTFENFKLTDSRNRAVMIAITGQARGISYQTRNDFLLSPGM